MVKTTEIKRHQMTKVINKLKEGYPDLPYDLIPQCGIKTDENCKDGNATVEGCTLFHKAIKNLPILMPFLEPLTSLQNVLKEQLEQTTSKHISEETIVKPMGKMNKPSVSKRKNKIMNPSKKLKPNNKGGKLLLKFSNKPRKINWNDVSIWDPIQLDGKGLYTVNCYCGNPAIVSHSQFGDKSLLFLCGSLNKKCPLQLGEAAVDLLMRLMSTENLKKIPRPTCSCDCKRDNRLTIRGSAANVQDPKLWYKCPTCAISFYFDEHLGDIKKFLATSFAQGLELIESESESEKDDDDDDEEDDDDGEMIQ